MILPVVNSYKDELCYLLKAALVICLRRQNIMNNIRNVLIIDYRHVYEFGQ